MQTIIHKCVQLVYIFLFVKSVYCDSIRLNTTQDDMLLNYATGCTTACMAKMAKKTSANLTRCYYICEWANQNPITLKKIHGNGLIRLICRESDSLIVEISDYLETESTTEAVNQTRNNDLHLILLKFYTNENESAPNHPSAYITNSSIVEIKNLQENTSYTVNATIFNEHFEYWHLPPTKPFKTLETENYVPQMISNDTIEVEYLPQNNSNRLNAKLKWKPTDDMTCGYHFALYSPDAREKFQSDVRNVLAADLYHVVSHGLEYDTNYRLEINGFNVKDEQREGNKTFFYFTTPSCWEMKKYNSPTCKPKELKIYSTYEMIATDLYQVNVTWDKPQQDPDYYIVTLNMNSEGNMESKNVSGMETMVHFDKVYISDTHYHIHIEAHSSGEKTISEEDVKINEVHSSFFLRSKRFIRVLGLLLPFFIFLSVALIFLILQNRRYHSKNKEEIFSNELNLRKLIQTHKKDEMEIEPNNVELYELLGEGAFGIVRKGILKPNNKEIAVKMLKENATIEDIKGFLSEISLMKSVVQHKNIVGIVGHSTKLFSKMMLLTEYCSEGNLLDYLRKFRDMSTVDQFTLAESEIVTFQPSHEQSPEDIFNFDTKNIDKFTHKEKSILLADIGQTNSRRLLIPHDADTNHTHKHAMRNIIFNKLYDETQFFCDVPFVDGHNCKTNRKEEQPECTECSDDDIAQDTKLQKSDRSRSSADTYQSLTGRDLLHFALQIATGMEFLANNKIVHRDLAARNVLVCADKTIKIADFGLSRDIYVDNIYMKSSAGRLPIKWLALESMTDQKYTSQSDVWSFGILLYEIVTMGSTPYPLVPVDCLINYLKSGNRMSKPFNCSQDFYDLMYSCWHHEPEKRPTFTELLQKLDLFIKHPNINGIISVVDVKRNEWNNDPTDVENTSSTAYLNPF